MGSRKNCNFRANFVNCAPRWGQALSVAFLRRQKATPEPAIQNDKGPGSIYIFCAPWYFENKFELGPLSPDIGNTNFQPDWV